MTRATLNHPAVAVVVHLCDAAFEPMCGADPLGESSTNAKEDVTCSQCLELMSAVTPMSTEGLRERVSELELAVRRALTCKTDIYSCHAILRDALR